MMDDRLSNYLSKSYFFAASDIVRTMYPICISRTAHTVATRLEALSHALESSLARSADKLMQRRWLRITADMKTPGSCLPGVCQTRS